MIYEFEVPGKIIGKGRPRLNTYTGSVYTPTRTKDYESLVMQYFLLKYPRYKPFEGRVQVEINALFEVPKSTKKADKELMLSNQINPTKNTRRNERNSIQRRHTNNQTKCRKNIFNPRKSTNKNKPILKWEKRNIQ